MNKKQVNRYTLGIVVGIETRQFTNQYDLGEFFDKVQKYNSNPKNPFFLGKVKLHGNGLVEFKKYKKITEPSTLEKIDILTTMYDSQSDLKKTYGISTNNTHPIEILYRFNKDIRTLPVIYRKNKDYINRNFLRQFVNNTFAVTPELLTSILDNDQVEASCRTNIEDFDNLFALREKLSYNPNSDITSFSRFYSSFITQGGKFNYFNFRLLGTIFMKEDERKFSQADTTPEQLIIKEIELAEKREAYEEAKLKLTEY